jgi:hypothetical protein
MQRSTAANLRNIGSGRAAESGPRGAAQAGSARGRSRASSDPAERKQNLAEFVASLSTAWRDGEVRSTHRKPHTGPRPWRTRVDPFQDVWPLVERWHNEQPEESAKGLFLRLQDATSTSFAPGQLRTLQRRVRQWRTAIAERLVLAAGDTAADLAVVSNSAPCLSKPAALPATPSG